MGKGKVWPPWHLQEGVSTSKSRDDFLQIPFGAANTQCKVRVLPPLYNPQSQSPQALGVFISFTASCNRKTTNRQKAKITMTQTLKAAQPQQLNQHFRAAKLPQPDKALPQALATFSSRSFLDLATFWEISHPKSCSASLHSLQLDPTETLYSQHSLARSLTCPQERSLGATATPWDSSPCLIPPFQLTGMPKNPFFWLPGHAAMFNYCLTSWEGLLSHRHQVGKKFFPSASRRDFGSSLLQISKYQKCAFSSGSKADFSSVGSSMIPKMPHYDFPAHFQLLLITYPAISSGNLGEKS